MPQGSWPIKKWGEGPGPGGPRADCFCKYKPRREVGRSVEGGAGEWGGREEWVGGGWGSYMTLQDLKW